jgi:kumamolisin
MKRMTLSGFLSFVTAVCLLGFSPSVLAQAYPMTPKSSLPQPPNANGQIMARTHLRILVPGANKMNFGKAVQPSELPPFPGLFFETPASLGCVYRLVPNPVPGCNPNQTTENPSGGGRAVALVDAFDDPTAVSDLAIFSAQFGLPVADLAVVYATGAKPGLDPTGGWELEEALDTQWAHAMAPGAKLFLVEAPNNSLTNLFNAVIVASNLVAAAGGGEVSMSWGSGEFTEETIFDSVFTTPGVVYFASAGDSPGVLYPSASPNVVSAGGTTVSRNAVTGSFILEDTWQDAGGGASQVEPRPSFQNFVRFIVGNARGTPDLSFDSNPNTGVWLFDTNAVYGTGWFVVGGTSVAAPSLSGIINAAGGFRASSQAENQDIYSHILFSGDDFRDIVFGNCGLNIGTFALPGYDLCTGVGSDLGLRGK